eukprot:GCRY01002439.1.p1 GENE.GCRY01002439.1~~GCRY01002439.1.p1  ORF type:complete len:204 (+),score=57.36 GCRY01002439.1:118-729(+)
MGAIFSKKKKDNGITSHDKAILDLKVKQDRLKQYEKKIKKVIEREIEICKECMKKDRKDLALRALRKKKYQEDVCTKTEQLFQNLQELIDSIEFKQMEKQVFDGLKTGTQVLKDLNAEMSLEDVEKLMDDSEEAIAYQRQIDEILGNALTQADEDEVLAEFESLVGVDENAFPEVPNAVAEEEEEEVTEDTSSKAKTRTLAAA